MYVCIWLYKKDIPKSPILVFWKCVFRNMAIFKNRYLLFNFLFYPTVNPFVSLLKVENIIFLAYFKDGSLYCFTNNKSQFLASTKKGVLAFSIAGSHMHKYVLKCVNPFLFSIRWLLSYRMTFFLIRGPVRLATPLWRIFSYIFL